MSNQSKFQSFLESLTNVAIGYFVSFLSQLIVFPIYGIHITVKSNIAIGLWFTSISIARSYGIRRWFNKKNKENR
jgi:hypothetical protein